METMYECVAKPTSCIYMKWSRSEFTLCSCRRNSYGKDFVGEGKRLVGGDYLWKHFMEANYGSNV